MITLENLSSLLPYRFCAQPPTLKILEMHITRQILIGGIWRRLQTVNQRKKSDVLEHIWFRLRLPDALNPDHGDDEFPSLISSTPSRALITFLREESASPTVLAVTGLQYDSCSTSFFFYHPVSEDRIKTLASKLTSVHNRVSRGSEFCSSTQWVIEIT